MKIISLYTTAFYIALASTLPFLTTSCGAPHPGLQKQMDRDIMTEAERRGSGSTLGSQQGQGSRNYGHGGF